MKASWRMSMLDQPVVTRPSFHSTDIATSSIWSRFSRSELNISAGVAPRRLTISVLFFSTLYIQTARLWRAAALSK